MILKRFIVELHGPDDQPSEEGSSEEWALEDARAEGMFTDWVTSTPDLDFEEEYRILVFTDE